MEKNEIITFKDLRTNVIHTLRYIVSKEHGLKLVFEPCNSKLPVFFIWKKDCMIMK